MQNETVSSAEKGVASDQDRERRSRRVLDPVDRANEILFGLVMVMTFTTTLSASEAGRADVRAMLIGALGCNLAWAIIDAAMFLMSARAEHALAERTLQAVRTAESPSTAHRIIADALPQLLLPALSTDDLERMRLHLMGLPEKRTHARLNSQDLLGAAGVFLLVFLCTLPVVLPFILLRDASVALRTSNVVAIGLLFLTGYMLGRDVGRPWRVGLSMVVLGLAMVAVAVALGG